MLGVALALCGPAWAAEEPSVSISLADLPGPWTNPYSNSPVFDLFVVRLESKVVDHHAGQALVIDAVMKRSTDIPVFLSADWSGEVPLDEVALGATNRGRSEVCIGTSVVLEDGRRISSPAERLSPGEARTVRFSMLDADPPQEPGASGVVEQIQLELRGLRASVPYSVAFGELMFHRLPAVPPITGLRPISLKAKAGAACTLRWPPCTGPDLDKDLPVALTLEKRGHVFLNLEAPLACHDGSASLGPLKLHLPAATPGGRYELYADARRVPVEGQPLRRALVARIGVEQIPPAPPTRARIRPHNGALAVHLNGLPTTGLQYMTYHLGERYIRQFAHAGVNIVSFDTACGTHPYGLAADAWLKPGVFDFAQCDARATRVLSANPDAFLLIRCYIAAPAWWSDINPRECVVGMTPDGKLIPYEEPPGHRPGSWASEQWRRDMGRALRRFVRHLRAAPYADRVIGMVVCGGTTEEWMFAASNSGEAAADYSQPSVGRFRAWLRDRYESDDRLREAWADPAVTLAGADPPGVTELAAAGRGGFLELPRQQRNVDWWLYTSDLTCDTIEHFARIVKRESGGDWLCGAFYGYVVQFHEPRIVTAGHLAIDRMVRSPWLDFCFSPTLYSHRSLKPGGYSAFMSLTDTYTLHGKLWWSENDLRTFRVLDVPNVHADQIDRRQTPAETIALLRREFGCVSGHGVSQSWFDMGGGWYDDPQLLAEIRRQVQTAEKLLHLDRSPVSEVAVVISPEDFARQALFTTVNNWLVLGQVASLGAMGAPFDLVSLADMETLDPRKMWIFLNVHSLGDALIERIHRRLRNDRAIGVFVYAPGFLAPEDGMRRLTGMTILSEPERRRADVETLPGALGLPKPARYGTSSPVGPAHFPGAEITPTFHVEDEAAEVVGVDAATGLPGLCLKTMDGWTSVYSAAPGISSDVLRALATRAGAHVYVDGDAVVYANASMLSVTVVEAGERTIRLPGRRTVEDAITGELIALRTQEFAVHFAERESKLFLLSGT